MTRGTDLLLTHLGLLERDEEDERPSARERLEEELGPGLTARLLGRYDAIRPTPPGRSSAAPFDSA